MTGQKITHNGEEYFIPQNVIDDLMKFHDRDAVKEVEEMLKRNDEKDLKDD
jgi:GTP cyclohydrolase FolE2